MKVKTFSVLLIMLIVAIVAVGSVSAAEDATIDIADEPANDIVIEDVAADDVDESASDVETDDVAVDVNEESRTVPAISYTTYNVNTSSDFDYINTNIANGNFDGYEFVFASGTYNNFAMVTGNNNKFTGNGATIIGSTDNLFTVAGSSNIIITGFNMQVATGKAAVYGANVFHAEITNNNISGGKDGINIMQTYDDVTITGNTITGVTRDAISLVDHRNLSDSEWANRDYSVVSNNRINGSEYAMFFGGNFKGTIEDNIITGSDCAMQFAGKKAATNGKLYADIIGNEISNVQMGIDMNHPGVDNLFIALNNIETLSNTTCFVINQGPNFAKLPGGQIWVYSNYLYGMINQTFINACDDFDTTTNYGYVVVP